MKIGIDAGHTLSGAGTGASGYVKETDKNRAVYKKLSQMLIEKGHQVINCTVDYSSNDLAARVSKANTQSLDFFISLHLNAFRTTNDDMGVETYIYNGSYNGKVENKVKAQAIQNALVSKVGWKDRKVKEANFYVLRETIAPAVLVELGFCDSKADMDKFDDTKVAAALFKGLTGAEYVAPAPPKPAPKPDDKTGYRVVCGTYSDKNNAIKQQAALKEKGFDSFLLAVKL